eukprot:363931-Chlamydomonas_euryale.AAC.9
MATRAQSADRMMPRASNALAIGHAESSTGGPLRWCRTTEAPTPQCECHTPHQEVAAPPYFDRAFPERRHIPRHVDATRLVNLFRCWPEYGNIRSGTGESGRSNAQSHAPRRLSEVAPSAAVPSMHASSALAQFIGDL